MSAVEKVKKKKGKGPKGSVKGKNKKVIGESFKIIRNTNLFTFDQSMKTIWSSFNPMYVINLVWKYKCSIGMSRGSASSILYKLNLNSSDLKYSDC